ncbi:MAG: hypothetical protein ISQ90_05145 [Rhodospirillales bacterium]|jgi:hypothetical protein|nr:hypothetical protein [Rhodospirillales bacterium]
MVLYRKSRLHDEKDNIAPLSEILRIPIIISQAILKKLFNYYPSSPCIVYGAKKVLDSIIDNNMLIVEFGSGQSTHWYAKRCQKIISHETSEKWFVKVKQNLLRAGCFNANVIKWDGESISQEIKTLSPDLIIIDGIRRDICVDYATKVAKDSTWIYLDNSDKDMHPSNPNTEMRVCEQGLIEFARSENREIKYFTGFAPAQFFGEQGMLVCPKN